jgi:hypothetical protein
MDNAKKKILNFCSMEKRKVSQCFQNLKPIQTSLLQDPNFTLNMPKIATFFPFFGIAMWFGV